SHSRRRRIGVPRGGRPALASRPSTSRTLVVEPRTSAARLVPPSSATTGTWIGSRGRSGWRMSPLPLSDSLSGSSLSTRVPFAEGIGDSFGPSIGRPSEFFEWRRTRPLRQHVQRWSELRRRASRYLRDGLRAAALESPLAVDAQRGLGPGRQTLRRDGSSALLAYAVRARLACTKGGLDLRLFASQKLLGGLLQLALVGEVRRVGRVLTDDAQLAGLLALVALERGVVLGLAQRLEILGSA